MARLSESKSPTPRIPVAPRIKHVQAAADVGQPDAALSRSGPPDARTVVPDRQGQRALAGTRFDPDADAEPQALDIEVLVQEREVALERDELRRFGEQAGAQQVPQAHNHSPGPARLASDQRQERVQGVEEEVRLELRLQSRELCLEEGAANRLARGQPPDAQAVPTPDEKETGGRAEDPEPGRLEQGARERHFRYRTAIAPDAVLVGSEHVEPVAPRRQVRVIG